MPDTSTQIYLDRGQELIRKITKDFSDNVVAKLVEANFPDFYWQTWFVCSPRGRVLRRREKPLVVKWSE